jgi:hypothetical protein
VSVEKDTQRMQTQKSVKSLQQTLWLRITALQTAIVKVMEIWIDNFDCGENQFCINTLCECQTGYEYKPFDNSCHRKIFNLDSDCNSLDKNIVCSENQCKCKSGFSSNRDTNTCKPIVCIYCESNSVCAKEDQYIVCVDSKCYCKPNYKLDIKWNYCAQSMTKW